MNSDWKQALKQDGYCVLPKVVPPQMLDDARADLGRLLWSREKQSGWLGMSGEGYKAIHALMRESPAADYVDQALGWKTIDYQRDGQVVIRRAKETEKKLEPEHHLDGFFPDQCIPFALLVGVTVNQAPDLDFAGNLAVWPGTHYRHEQYFRDRTPDAMKGGMPKIDVGPPKQIPAGPGDVILCHFQLAHGGVVNTSDLDRIAVYFRVWTFIDHWKQLTNLWEGWKI